MLNEPLAEKSRWRRSPNAALAPLGGSMSPRLMRTGRVTEGLRRWCWRLPRLPKRHGSRLTESGNFYAVGNFR